MRVLIAEDNDATRKMLETLLVKWGYEVSLARDGGQAWEILFSKDPPGMVLLDWMMPRMDGIELCREIRAARSGVEASYIILLTARSERSDLIAGLEAGADDYMVKPFHADELKMRIQSGRRILALQEALGRRGKIQGVLEMAGAVCHELNQPLQAIMSDIYLAMLEMKKSDPLYESMAHIRTQVDRMADITRKLMRITRYETRDYIEGRKIVDIDKAAGEAPPTPPEE